MTRGIYPGVTKPNEGQWNCHVMDVIANINRTLIILEMAVLFPNNLILISWALKYIKHQILVCLTYFTKYLKFGAQKDQFTITIYNLI